MVKTLLLIVVFVGLILQSAQEQHMKVDPSCGSPEDCYALAIEKLNSATEMIQSYQKQMDTRLKKMKIEFQTQLETKFSFLFHELVKQNITTMSTLVQISNSIQSKLNQTIIKLDQVSSKTNELNHLVEMPEFWASGNWTEAQCPNNFYLISCTADIPLKSMTINSCTCGKWDCFATILCKRYKY